MRIAIIGSRGIPARYGGFETFAAELSPRLGARGHQVTVYSRRGRVDEGALPPRVEQRFVPMLPTKYLETVSHTFFSVLDVLVHRHDAVLMVNAANAVFSGLPRVVGTPVVLNVDGIERKRAKWGPAGRLWYRLGERLATVYPNAVVTDAQVIREYYLAEHGRGSVMIPYGAPVLERDPPPDLRRHGLEPDRYVLYVSRLEPENNAHQVIEAYRDVPGSVPLVIVGDAPYATDYKERVRALAGGDDRVRLLGAIYGEGYRDLQRGALAYIQATEVGGTHPALVEAMAAGNMVLAYGTPENREVLGEAGIVYTSPAELRDALERVVDPAFGGDLETYRVAARERARARYSWDAVTEAYEGLLTRVGSRPRLRVGR